MNWEFSESYNCNTWPSQIYSALCLGINSAIVQSPRVWTAPSRMSRVVISKLQYHNMAWMHHMIDFTPEFTLALYCALSLVGGRRQCHFLSKHILHFRTTSRQQASHRHRRFSHNAYLITHTLRSCHTLMSTVLPPILGICLWFPQNCQRLKIGAKIVQSAHAA